MLLVVCFLVRSFVFSKVLLQKQWSCPQKLPIFPLCLNRSLFILHFSLQIIKRLILLYWSHLYFSPSRSFHRLYPKTSSLTFFDHVCCQHYVNCIVKSPSDIFDVFTRLFLIIFVVIILILILGVFFLSFDILGLFLNLVHLLDLCKRLVLNHVRYDLAFFTTFSLTRNWCFFVFIGARFVISCWFPWELKKQICGNWLVSHVSVFSDLLESDFGNRLKVLKTAFTVKCPFFCRKCFFNILIVFGGGIKYLVFQLY